ncbi:MAG: hypothetical protein JSW68_03265, partial [Burkholderiales bacterium]
MTRSARSRLRAVCVAAASIATCAAALLVGHEATASVSQSQTTKPSGLDARLVEARHAFRRNDLDRFERAARSIDAHALGVYLEYWRLSLRIDDSRPQLPRAESDAAIERLLARDPGTLVADLLRRDWMLDLGRRGQWDRFDAQYAQWILRDDERVECYRLLGQVDRGRKVAEAARALLMQEGAMRDECHELFDLLLETGQFGPDDLWRRLWLALETGATPTVRQLARLHPALSDQARTLARVLRRPDSAFAIRGVAKSRELSMIALARLAWRDPSAAARRMQSLSLGARDRAALSALIGAAAAADHLPEALEW